MGKLADYPIPDKVVSVALNKEPSQEFLDRISRWAEDTSLTRAGKDTYNEAFRTMIYFEEFHQQQMVEKFNLKGGNVQQVDWNEFMFECPIESLGVAIDNGLLSRFVLHSADDAQEIGGSISRRDNEKIYVSLYDGVERFNEDTLYDIKFKINRIPFQVQHKALDFIRSHKLFEILIENPKYSTQETHPHENEHRESAMLCENELNNSLNEEQIQAVQRISSGNYHPLPYILYGPAGTGKTKTIVAAILNILKSSTKHILVCAQSNAACDEIAERLCQYLSPNELFRMYAMTQRPSNASSAVLAISNFYRGNIDFPPLDRLYRYRVVICTLSTAGCLTRAHCNPHHFSYVIIDECASTPETMALVPIAGLCTSVSEVHANIVLAGDPKQLDAVTKSEWATKLGFSVSWLEQLFKYPLYGRDTETGKFNSNYITHLVKNYRSHPSILHVPNQLFYDGLLEAKATPDVIDLSGTFPHLNPKFPVIFQSVQGFCQKTDNDTSSYNTEEVDVVLKLIDIIQTTHSKEIKLSDIGVVSPYRRQCKMIRQACRENDFNDITVGTSETFQGQERKVIIVSTVQSNQCYVGKFVSDPQRMNVMLTRAINLLVVIGDPHTLARDEKWATFIDFCYKNGGFIQSNHKFRPKFDKVAIDHQSRGDLKDLIRKLTQRTLGGDLNRVGGDLNPLSGE
ncbi:hypothetical protein HA402_005099 [Bradysia odoriphaga]|nr:hypothetical protein HA402_005099 [Bradysia odoriphaga]